MSWFRIDNRLVHGQVIEAWLPYLRATTLVVLNDALAVDELQQQIMQLAIPARISVQFSPVASARTLYEQSQEKGNDSVLFLLSDCHDAERVREQGVAIPVLNIGNMHYAPGKEQICAHVALSEDEKGCLQKMEAAGIALDFRAVPGDAPTVGAWNA